jgi:hypothetical protein
MTTLRTPFPAARRKATPLRVGALAAGVFVLLAACDGDGGATDPETCRVAELTVLPQDTTVFPGDAFSVLVNPAADCDVRVRFSVTSDVVEFDSATFLLTAKKVGRGGVVVRAGTVTDTAMVSVIHPPS